MTFFKSDVFSVRIDKHGNDNGNSGQGQGQQHILRQWMDKNPTGLFQ
jgi:hypothetical protein